MDISQAEERGGPGDELRRRLMLKFVVAGWRQLAECSLRLAGLGRWLAAQTYRRSIAR